MRISLIDMCNIFLFSKYDNEFYVEKDPYL